MPFTAPVRLARAVGVTREALYFSTGVAATTLRSAAGRQRVQGTRSPERASRPKGKGCLRLGKSRTFNDPSAGSPTETLLRLLLPLNATVWSSFR